MKVKHMRSSTTNEALLP